MKSSIVFFDSFQNSIRGTLRGIIIFFPIVILNYLFFKYYYNIKNTTVKFYIALIISSILIVSAIGVHNPNSTTKAVVYAGLVGFVVYGFMALWGFGSEQIKIKKCFITLAWGIITTALLGYILYLVVKKRPNTLAPL